MADITMCSGIINKNSEEECPRIHICYRHMAGADPFQQSYFTEIPGKWEISDDKDKYSLEFRCEYFLSVKDKR